MCIGGKEEIFLEQCVNGSIYLDNNNIFRYSKNNKPLTISCYCHANGGYKGMHVDLVQHQLVAMKKYGRPLVKGEVVDHINRNPFDNRAMNIRITSVAKNNQNRRGVVNCSLIDDYNPDDVGEVLEKDCSKSIWLQWLMLKSNTIDVDECGIYNLRLGKPYCLRKQNRLRFCIKGKIYYMQVSRAMWIYHNKRLIPDGYEIDHINSDSYDDDIENLCPVTHLENSLKRSTTRFTWEDIDAIRNDSRSSYAIANDYCVDSSYIRQIRRGEIWKKHK